MRGTLTGGRRMKVQGGPGVGVGGGSAFKL